MSLWGTALPGLKKQATDLVDANLGKYPGNQDSIRDFTKRLNDLFKDLNKIEPNNAKAVNSLIRAFHDAIQKGVGRTDVLNITRKEIADNIRSAIEACQTAPSPTQPAAEPEVNAFALKRPQFLTG